jgi:hypothetical protein
LREGLVHIAQYVLVGEEAKEQVEGGGLAPPGPAQVVPEAPEALGLGRPVLLGALSGGKWSEGKKGRGPALPTGMTPSGPAPHAPSSWR